MLIKLRMLRGVWPAPSIWIWILCKASHKIHYDKKNVMLSQWRQAA
jgi:hypothetical protein